MKNFLEQFGSTGGLLLPLVYALSVSIALELIYRLLCRTRVVQGHPIAYNSIILLTGVVVFIEWAEPLDAFRSIDGLRRLLRLVLFSLYAFLLAQAVVELLLGFYIQRCGVRAPRLLRDLMLAVLLIVAILLIYSAVFGVSNIGTLVVSSTVISAIIGLALQDLLKNLIAGIALQFERPFSAGDWVQIDGLIGQVRETSWRGTWIHTIDNTLLIMPNASVAEKTIANFSAGSRREALHVQIGLDYAVPPNQAKQVLTAAALATLGVLRTPTPTVYLVEYAASSIIYDIKFWLDDYSSYFEARDAVMTSIWYHLRRAGLTIPYPIQDLNVRPVTSESEALARQQHFEDIVARLRTVGLLAMLSDQALRELAARTRLRLFGQGETLVYQGDQGESFFIINAGLVRVDVSGSNGTSVSVNQLGPGDFFGELSLLTGAPRTATIIALSECQVLEIDRDAIAPLLEHDPELPERLGAVLERRLQLNAELMAAIERGQTQDAGTLDTSRNGLVSRIRNLFGLT